MNQVAFIEYMLDSWQKPVLGIEMVSVEKQPVLDSFNAGELAVDALPEALDWKNSVGYDFDLYRPLFELAAARHLPVYALNVPGRVVREARKYGLKGVSAANSRYLPKNLLMPPAEQRDALWNVFMRHASMLPFTLSEESAVATVADLQTHGKDDPAEFERFLLAQSIWDSGMAEQAVAVRKKTGRIVALIVGVGHVEYGWGIASRLRVYDKDAKCVNVMPWRRQMETSELLGGNPSPVKPDDSSTAEFPPTNLADAYYYVPASPLSKSEYGFLIAGSANEGGLRILAVEKESLAALVGLRADDVIMFANGRKVHSAGMFQALAAQLRAYDQPLVLRIKRAGNSFEIKLPS